MFKRLPPEEKVRLIKRVLAGEALSKVCREVGISRTIFYSWLKKYQQAAPRSKKIVLKSRVARGEKHWRRIAPVVERKIVKTALQNSSFSPQKISTKVGISSHGVWNVLKNHDLNTKEKRENYLYKYGDSLIKPPSTDEKLTMIRRFEKDEKVAKLCQEFNLSRPAFYKWLKRYQKASEDNKRESLETWRPKEEEHWRYVPEAKNLVLEAVREAPQLSPAKISQQLPIKAEKPILGSHGVYNLLRRLNLNTYPQRLAFAQTQPIISRVQPIPWQSRIRQVFETFVPQVAPAPPPRRFAPRSKLLTSFFLSLFSTTIFSTLFIFWLSMMASQPGGLRVGLFFATIALLVGSFFFLYSMKYYFTLALVLSFSTQTTGEENGKWKMENGKLADGGWLRRIFGLKEAAAPREAQRSGGGLQANLDHITLSRYPFISIHLPFYNESKVANRILAACTSFDYPNYEVIVCDDSTDETVEIVKEWENHPRVKVLHRPTREGFKGGALKYALQAMDGRTEFVIVFDADFVPYPDTLTQFMKYFKATGGWREDLSYQTTNLQTMPYQTNQKVELSPQEQSIINHQSSSILSKNSIACVAGYQWHVLNKSENWITRGVRTEYAGSYVIERPGQEILGAMKIIHGSVYCMRADVLKHFGWGTSITEDYELTLRIYEKGFKVIFTPYIQAPSECVATVKRLIRQRMRWAEGHSFNTRKMFLKLLFGKWEVRSGKLDTEVGSEKENQNPNISLQNPASHLQRHTSKRFIPSPLTLTEKLEFLYLAPYYLQAFLFLLGTFSWLISETVFGARLPFWTSLWGWSLVLTNFFALPLMNAVGLFLEESEEKDYLGIFSFLALCYIVTPFQAYAAVKGFLEPQEGPWFRTPKTGKITDIFSRGRFYRWLAGILPGRFTPASARMSTDVSGYQRGFSANPYLALTTANNRFETPPVSRMDSKEGFFDGFFNFNFNLKFFGQRGIRLAKRYVLAKGVLASFLTLVLMLNYMAFFTYQTKAPVTPIKESITADKESVQTRLSNGQVSEAPEGAETQRSSLSALGGGGEVITTLEAPINTNLQENPEALRVSQNEPGVAWAAETTEVYRWTVPFERGTTYYFGLVDGNPSASSGQVRPVVKMRNKEGWFVKYEFSISNSQFPIYVEPKVEGNSIEWELANGIVARYTALKDRIKADYIINHKSSIINQKLDFIVNYNDSYAGDTQEEADEGVEEGKGYLKHELLPNGSIAWLNEAGTTVFDMPKPVIKEDTKLDVGNEKLDTEMGSEKSHITPQSEAIPASHVQSPTSTASFAIQKSGEGISLLSIKLPSNLNYPATIDPVVVDSAATTTGTAYGNGRKLLRDAWGNLIALINGGTGSDDVWYKNYNATSWIDAGNQLGTAGGSTVEISADLDSANNIHYAFRDTTANSLYIGKLTITRDGSNTITGTSSTGFSYDTSGKSARPSLIIANKGEGAGKEKVALAWAVNGTGGTKRGEIRFMQCDVANNCTLVANWKNASEEANGSGTCSDTGTGNAGMPNAVTCSGVADIVFQAGVVTTHHAVLTQVPGRPARTPTNVKKDQGDGINFNNLTNTIDDNTGTSDTTNVDNSRPLYIGDDNKFSKIVTDVATSNSTSSTLTIQYFNGSIWTAVGNPIDNTQNTAPFQEDGSILFDEPANWAKTTVDSANKYWIKISFSDGFSLSVTEFDITDRHSKSLLILGGDSVEEGSYINSLETAYVIWDEVGQAGWENNPASPGAPWRSGVLSNKLISWNDYTNFPLTTTVDPINNAVYYAWVCYGAGTMDCPQAGADPELLVGRWGGSAAYGAGDFPVVTEGTDIVLNFASDGNDIYLFYVLNPGTNGLVYRKLTEGSWGSEQTLDSGTDNTHPQAIISKAVGDTVALDVVYTTTTTPAVEYERHYVNMADKTTVVAASGDDGRHYDCDIGSSADDQDISYTVVNVGRSIAVSGCGNGDAEMHSGFHFPSVSVSQGTAISSAYLDFRVPNSTNPLDFTIYGQDSDCSGTNCDFDAFTDNCPAANQDNSCIGDRMRTATSSDFTGSAAITFVTNSYRLDVTNIVQEIVCRGASNSQPCVGNFYGSGNWASGNAIALLLISSEGGADNNNVQITAFDSTGTVMLDPTLQINCGGSSCGTGNAGRNYSLGVVKPATGSASYNDLGHPFFSTQFGAVNTDDTGYASVSASMVPSASPSASPIFLFKSNNSNNNNTDEIQVSAIVKSTIPTKSYGGPHPSGKPIYLQIYRGGSTNDWVNIDCNGPTGCDTGVAPDTDITLSGSVTSSLTDYYRSYTPGGSCTGSDCWATIRIYQDPAPEANQILYVDLVSFTFVPERLLWLLPLALFLPRIIQWYNRRRANTLILTNGKRI